MCFAAMALAGVKAVFYAHSNEDGELYGLSTAGLYSELAAPAGKRSLKMSHIPVRSESEEDLYQLWSSTAEMMHGS